MTCLLNVVICSFQQRNILNAYMIDYYVNEDWPQLHGAKCVLVMYNEWPKQMQLDL